ncbi:hypothetical protein [Chitinophaga sp. RAB17]|uniref:hypothetical protein n=1 Tax=Chitinophaga sp. RAB17 TaxID=3233049 RepID=UPI003F8E8734
MKMYFAIKILLAFHIIGLVIMAGTTTIDYLTFKTFWKLVDQGDHKSLGLLPLMARYGAFVRAGAVIMLLTGITMLTLVNGTWWDQLWFRIKMILVMLLITNGMFVGSKLGHKLRTIINENANSFIPQTIGVRDSLQWFYLIQLILFFLIILVSVVRPDKIPN